MKNFLKSLNEFHCQKRWILYIFYKFIFYIAKRDYNIWSGFPMIFHKIFLSTLRRKYCICVLGVSRESNWSMKYVQILENLKKNKTRKSHFSRMIILTWLSKTKSQIRHPREPWWYISYPVHFCMCTFTCVHMNILVTASSQLRS